MHGKYPLSGGLCVCCRYVLGVDCFIMFFSSNVCVCVHVCACVRACVRACVWVYVLDRKVETMNELTEKPERTSLCLPVL